MTDPIKVADRFNKHFTTIANQLQNNIHNSGQNFRKYLTNRNEKSIFIYPTDENEVLKLISKIDENKASGPHSISSNILKYISPIIAEPLAKIINLSFKTGVYIESIKVSKVIPVFKEKRSNLDRNNY